MRGRIITSRKIDLKNKTDCPVTDQRIQSSDFITKISIRNYVKKRIAIKKKKKRLHCLDNLFGKKIIIPLFNLLCIQKIYSTYVIKVIVNTKPYSA